MTMRRLWRGRFGAIAMVAGLAGALTPTGAGAQVPPPGQACFDEHPCQLSSLPDDDRQVLGVFPSADGERVVYLADQDTYGVLELYSVPVAEGQRSTRLNLPRTRISGVQISPDSTRVLYVAHTEPGGPGDPGPASLYSVPIAGPASASVRLVADVAETAFHVPGYRISPDSGKVVYAPPARDRLMVVPIDGPASARQRLTDGLVAGGAIFEFDVSANSKSLVYRADQDILSVAELYRVPLTLSPAPDPPTVKLSAPLVAGGEVSEFVLAPNNGRVVYLASADDPDDPYELYSVGLGGAGRVKLNTPLPAEWHVIGPGEGGTPARITADGTRVVYEISNGEFIEELLLVELYSVPIAGPASASVRLDRSTEPAPGLRPYRYQVSADSAWVVYAATDDNFNQWLVSVPTAGPASASKVMTWPATEVPVFTISPDSTRVIHSFESGSLPVLLLSTPIDHPAGSVRINGDESPGGQYLIDASSTRVVYGNGFDLFSAPIDGAGDRYNLSESFDSPLISHESLTAGGGRVVYTVKDGFDGPTRQLYSSPLVPPILPPTDG